MSNPAPKHTACWTSSALAQGPDAHHLLCGGAAQHSALTAEDSVVPQERPLWRHEPLPGDTAVSSAHLGELPPTPGCAMKTLSRVQALKTRQPSAACKLHTAGMPAAPYLQLSLAYGTRICLWLAAHVTGKQQLSGSCYTCAMPESTGRLSVRIVTRNLLHDKQPINTSAHAPLHRRLARLST